MHLGKFQAAHQGCRASSDQGLVEHQTRLEMAHDRANALQCGLNAL